MKICLLTDCDCNKTGYCTDNYAAATTYAFVTSASRCQSYNPREEDDENENG